MTQSRFLSSLSNARFCHLVQFKAYTYEKSITCSLHTKGINLTFNYFEHEINEAIEKSERKLENKIQLWAVKPTKWFAQLKTSQKLKFLLFFFLQWRENLFDGYLSLWFVNIDCWVVAKKNGN